MQKLVIIVAGCLALCPPNMALGQATEAGVDPADQIGFWVHIGGAVRNGGLYNLGSAVTLSWNTAFDAETSSGLYYNVRIGTTSDGNEISAGMALTPDGTRLIPALGNAGQNLSITTTVPPGLYYYSVQTIDNVFAGSPWATEQTIDTRPIIAQGPAALTFNSTIGDPGPATQTATIQNTGIANTTLRWVASTDKPWLQVTPYSGSKQPKHPTW